MNIERFKILLGIFCFIAPFVLGFPFKPMASLTTDEKTISIVSILVYWYIQYKLITRTIDFPGPGGL